MGDMRNELLQEDRKGDKRAITSLPGSPQQPVTVDSEARGGVRRAASRRLQDRRQARRWQARVPQQSAARTRAGPVLHSGTVPQRGGIPMNMREAPGAERAEPAGRAVNSCARVGEATWPR